MIRVKDLHGKQLYINVDMIEFLEANPDTQIVMNDGRRVFVRETPEDIVELIVAYKQRCSRWREGGGGPAPAQPGG
ncbi:MAG: flagellar FlbD family protein [Lentisphaerae bacterium]|nr:flagellar FlbD family protein [Lentisphaerota bacterium]